MRDAHARSHEAIGRVRALRESKGMSAQDLADRTRRCGRPVTRAVIANLDTGRRASLTVDELCAFADALGSTPAGLLGGGPLCAACDDQPPAGFRCLSCGSEATP